MNYKVGDEVEVNIDRETLYKIINEVENIRDKLNENIDEIKERLDTLAYNLESGEYYKI